MAELVDAHGSGPCTARCGGSNPLLGTSPLFHKASKHAINPIITRLSGQALAKHTATPSNTFQHYLLFYPAYIPQIWIGGGMAYFRKSGRGWRAEIEKHGVRDSASFPTKREAQEWAAKREAEIVAGSSGQVIRVTLSEAIDRYIKEITPSKASARSEKLRLRALQRHPLAKKIMQDITTADLAAWRDERLSRVQPASVIRETNSLKALWRQAKRLEWNYVDHEPWKEVTTPKAPPARTQAYTQAQVDKIVAALGYKGGEPKTRKHEAAIAF